jgi:TrmH family RNA methyltransferase
MFMSWAHNIRFILVEPEFPGNIGAAARALKTMGFSQLYAVRPGCSLKDVEAFRMAHNAEEILERIVVVDCLEEALADTSFSIATTQRPRRQNLPFHTAAKMARILLKRAKGHPVALVFGRETSGLTNHEIALCSTLSTIPSATRVPSLNLAQAVMVYAYEIFQASLSSEEWDYPWRLAAHDDLERFYDHLADTLVRLGARPATSLDAYIDKFRRVFSRVPLEERDVQLLHKLLDTVTPSLLRRPRSSRHE